MGRTLHINPNPCGKSGHDSERYGGDYEKRENILPTEFFNFLAPQQNLWVVTADFGAAGFCPRSSGASSPFEGRFRPTCSEDAIVHGAVKGKSLRDGPTGRP